jgi:thiosulfate/3-mercaptopyruvate sulfurtransferase
VDEDTTAYLKGHIRNAVAWNWFKDLHDPLRREYVGPHGLSRVLQQAGAGPKTTVVVYGGNNNWFAAYAYWLLRYLGFDRVRSTAVARSGSWRVESWSRTSPWWPRPISGSPPRFAVSYGSFGTKCSASWAQPR